MTPAAVDAPHPRLVGDIGGTHARFGWVAAPGAAVSQVDAYPCDDFAGFEAVIRHHLARRALPAPRSCALGVAGPVLGDAVGLTNRDWTVSVGRLQAALGLERCIALNDFEALAFALPALTPAELRQVGGGAALAGAPRALIGPGTGLGVSGLLGDGTVALAGEGGHATLAAEDDAEDRVIATLRGWFGHVSAERVLSGPGLVNLYRASCVLANAPEAPLAPRDVIARALDASDAQCVEAVERFFAFLGAVAGDLVLTLGARGGVYLGGGIVPRLGDWIDRSTFRARFEAKGRFAGYLAPVPAWVVSGEGFPALRGANRALDGPVRRTGVHAG